MSHRMEIALLHRIVGSGSTNRHRNMTAPRHRQVSFGYQFISADKSLHQGCSHTTATMTGPNLAPPILSLPWLIGG